MSSPLQFGDTLALYKMSQFLACTGDGAENAAIDWLVSSWSENICFNLSTGTMIPIDFVMRPRSPSRGRRNTSASVTVTIVVTVIVGCACEGLTTKTRSSAIAKCTTRPSCLLVYLMTFIGRQSTYQQLINHFYVTGHESYRVPQNTPFKVIQGHRFLYQSKAHMRLPISD